LHFFRNTTKPISKLKPNDCHLPQHMSQEAKKISKIILIVFEV